MNQKIERLLKGETFVTRERGFSMEPLIKDKEDHIVAPTVMADIRVGDIVYCSVKGKCYTHLVIAMDPIKGLLIGNNKGNINGWTKKLFGKVTLIKR